MYLVNGWIRNLQMWRCRVPARIRHRPQQRVSLVVVRRWTATVNYLERLLIRRIEYVRGGRVKLPRLRWLRRQNRRRCHRSRRLYFYYIEIQGILLREMNRPVMHANVGSSLVLHVFYGLLVSEGQLTLSRVECKDVGLRLQRGYLPLAERQVMRRIEIVDWH